MPVAGTLIAESIRDGGALELEVRLRRMFRQPVANAAPGQPQMWTFIDFRCDDDKQADAFAHRLSKVMRDGPWYADLGNDADKWIVYAGRVFRFARTDAAGRQAAVAHGRACGVPEAQLDWAP